jgi:uncharacterized protein
MTIPTLQRLPEFLSWQDIDRLIDHLLPQLTGDYDALLIITRGGIIPGGLIAEALDLRHILTAAVQFPKGGQERLAWPTFMQFPTDNLLKDKRILIIDDIWENGRTISTVTGRVKAAGGVPETAVLHYKPGNSLFRDAGPNHYAAVTDRFIVYPWEIERGLDRVAAGEPERN